MSKRKAQPFVVSFGEEEFFLDADLARAKAWRGRSRRLLDGSTCTAADIVSACESFSLDGQDMVVILDNAQDVKADKALKRYVKERDPEDVSTILFVVYRGAKLPEVWAEAAKKGRVAEHPKLKTYESNNEVVKWMPVYAKHLGVRLGDGVAELLFKGLGSDLYKLAGELAKLTILVGEGNKVEVEHVRKVVAPTFPVEPSQVAEAAFKKDTKGALNAVALLYKAMGDDAAVPILASLMRQAEKLTLARHMLDQEYSEDDVATLLGYNPWWCRTFFLPIARKHDMATLVQTMGRLSRLDADVKGPSPCKRTLLELAVISIAH